MRASKSRLLILASLCLLPSLPVSADTLILTNGDRRKGLVEDDPSQPDKILFTDAGGRTTIDRSRVAEVAKEPLAVGLAAIGNQMYEKGLLNEALDYYRRALEADPKAPQVQESIAATEAELERRASNERRQQMLEVSEKMRTARELYEGGKFPEAQALLEEAAKMKPTDTQATELKQIRIQMLMAWGRERLDRLDVEGAAEKFQAVLALAPNHVQAANELIELWKDDRTRTDKMRGLLEIRLKENPADADTTKMLADIAYREKQLDRALPLYRKLMTDSSAWVGTEVETRLRQILETMRDKTASDGRLQDAIQYQKELIQRFPDSDATLLDVYDYRIRFSALKPEDEKGWIALAKWAEAKEKDDRFAGLFKPIDLYRRVLQLNPQNEEALRAYRTAAQQQLAQAQDEFTKGNYYLAKSLADGVQTEYPLAEQVVLRAFEISEKSDLEIRKQRDRAVDSAKLLLQSGDEYYQRAQYNQGLLLSTSENIKEVPVVTNPRHESIKYYELAIRAYQQAVDLAPNLPQIASGEVQIKLRDARTMIQRLKYPINYGLPNVPSR